MARRIILFHINLNTGAMFIQGMGWQKSGNELNILLRHPDSSATTRCIHFNYVTSAQTLPLVQRRDSSVGIKTRLRAGGSDDRGSIPGGGWELFSLTVSRTALGPTQPPIQWVPEAISQLLSHFCYLLSYLFIWLLMVVSYLKWLITWLNYLFT
jgi:hypothetical protein